jgi:predicted GIY-YIG superfamily endonuclease
MSKKKKPTALYRAYSATDELLYVGVSISVMARLSQHKSSADWFDGTSRIDVEWYPTKREALAAEMQAIKTEYPIYNKMGRVAESVEMGIEHKGITAGSLKELGWYCKLWCRLVGKWEDKARNEPSIVMSLKHWKQAEQNADKVDIIWLRRKKRLHPRWSLWSEIPEAIEYRKVTQPLPHTPYPSITAA